MILYAILKVNCHAKAYSFKAKHKQRIEKLSVLLKARGGPRREAQGEVRALSM